MSSEPLTFVSSLPEAEFSARLRTALGARLNELSGDPYHPTTSRVFVEGTQKRIYISISELRFRLLHYHLVADLSSESGGGSAVRFQRIPASFGRVERWFFAGPFLVVLLGFVIEARAVWANGALAVLAALGFLAFAVAFFLAPAIVVRLRAPRSQSPRLLAVENAVRTIVREQASHLGVAT